MQTFVGKVEEFVRFDLTGRTYAGLDAGSSVAAETDRDLCGTSRWVEGRVLLILCLVILAYQCWV